MRLATSPRLLPVGREEREAKLKDFVAANLTQRLAAAGEDTNCYTVLARGPDSPVAAALAALAGDLRSGNIVIRAILLDLDGMSEDQVKSSLLDMNNVEIRLLQDPRFTSAHEQLVLSSSRVWIGDCMRRDPAKRDAFEMFHDQNPIAATHAAVSFSRMWAGAKPVRRVRPIAPELVLASQIPTDGEQQQPAPRR
ncbi:MAG: hypothetical protein ABL907_23635 [Hyphomicrobium sp.]